MDRRQKWVAGIGAVTIVLCVAGLALAHWLPTDDELALQLSTRAEEALGVKVSIGSVHWSLLPTPVIIVKDFRTQQEIPVVVGQLSAYPSLLMLVRRKLTLERVDVDGATVPRNSIHALHGKKGIANQFAQAGVPLEHLSFHNVTWISYSGIATAFDGEIDFDPHWRPRRAELHRPSVTPPFTLTLTREAGKDRWQTRILVGGGTAHGQLALETDDDGAMHLRGKLSPRDIEVASAVSAFNRRSPVSGQGSGQTTVSADGKTFGDLTGSLHTHTQFTVSSAILLRFDLNKAISTRGREHDGQTPLQELTGHLDTQNGAEGMSVTGNDIRARAGKFTATGEGTVYHRQIDASGSLDIVEGAIGVPFTLSGSVQHPKITLPPGFIAGAAIGTVLLPVVGTAIGARIGSAIGNLFKGDVRK